MKKHKKYYTLSINIENKKKYINGYYTEQPYYTVHEYSVIKLYNKIEVIKVVKIILKNNYHNFTSIDVFLNEFDENNYLKIPKFTKKFLVFQPNNFTI